MDRLQKTLPQRYTLIRQLDGGGMSRVYQAREELPERDVVIKVLDEGLSARLGRERFVREVEVTSKLSHPHIVPIYAAGEAGGTLYYVMPYIDGESLRDRLDREDRLPVADALRITQEIADALQHAHDRGVVHRDIKPSNILFQSGFAVVTDFGIARALSAAEDAGNSTQSGTMLGTPNYMSPEQASGDQPVDGRTDMYGLACVLYEMLGGEPPFHSRSPSATLARHLTDSMPSLRTLRSTVHEEIEDAIRRALSKVPADRFASVADFSKALYVAPRLAVGGPRANTGSGRWHAPFGTSVRIVGTMLVVASVGLVWQAWSGDPEPVVAGETWMDSVAVMPLENRTGDSSLESLGWSVSDEINGHLATVAPLKVIDSYSVVSLWREDLGIPKLLDSLNVGHLIRGHYDFRGDELWVVVSEVDGQGAIRSRKEYPLPVTGLDTAQRDLAHQIANSFLAHVGLGSPIVESELQMGPGRDAYLRGNASLGQRTPEAMVQAIAEFQRSLELGPGYAPAHAALSSAYALAIYYKYDVGVPAFGLAGMAISAADRAVALDADLANGYAARGFVRALLRLDLDAAEADFARANELAPNAPNGPSWSARVLAARGRTDEAFAEARRARDLDPLQAGRRNALATLAFQLGHYDITIEEARQAQRLEPTLALARAFEGRALAMVGRGEECLRLDLGVYAAVRALCLQVLDRSDEASALIAGLEERLAGVEGVYPGYLDELVMEDLAAFHAFTGDAARAAGWLRRAFDRSPNGVDARILGSAIFDLVRDDPDFRDAVNEARGIAADEVRMLVEQTPPMLGM